VQTFEVAIKTIKGLLVNRYKLAKYVVAIVLDVSLLKIEENGRIS